MDLYKKAEQFVIDSFSKIGKESQIPHFKRTVFWIKELNPQADEALLIAAIAHDIERASRKEDMEEKKKNLEFDDLEFLRPHEERGAEIIGKFLEKEKASEDLIEKVKNLVSRHEEGGDDDQNLLKDADSISFFENNVFKFLENNKHLNKEKNLAKIYWMNDRISSKKAKMFAKPFYDEAIEKLNKLR